MEPVLGVAVLLLLFAGAHLGLAAPPVRGRLVGRLGEEGFTWLFSGLAAVTFAAFLAYYAVHRFEGPAGLGLGRFDALHGVLVVVNALGFVFMVASLFGYGSSPMAKRGDSIREPRGLQRITRHGFFVGVALFGGAHALLATRLVGTVAWGGLGLFALVGAWLQDRKLLALRGKSYADYLAKTSTLPFGAILAGRQRLAAQELSAAGIALGLAVALLLRQSHAHLLDHGGAYVTGVLVGGALVFLIQGWLRQRRGGPHRARS